MEKNWRAAWPLAVFTAYIKQKARMLRNVFHYVSVVEKPCRNK